MMCRNKERFQSLMSSKSGKDCGGFSGPTELFYQSLAMWRTNLGLERPLPTSTTIYKKDRILILWHFGPELIIKCIAYGENT